MYIVQYVIRNFFRCFTKHFEVALEQIFGWIFSRLISANFHVHEAVPRGQLEQVVAAENGRL